MKNKCIISFIIAMFACSCTMHGDTRYIKSIGTVFGTYYAITYSSDKDLTEGMEKVMDRINKSLSTFDKSSVISGINNNDSTVVLTPDFKTVLEKSIKVSQATGGAFDITVAPLVNIWGFGFDPADDRNQEQIDGIRSFVGYDKIKLQDNRVIKQDSRIMLDASAIAKGYACDAVAAYLDSAGVENYLIDIGGELVTKGNNPSGQAWKVGISRPVENSETNEVERIISVSDKAVATSGNYRQFHINEGRKIGHTIDPRSGYPATNPLLSATVIADDCMTADAFATAFMVIGDTTMIKEISESYEDKIQWYVILQDSTGNHIEAMSEDFLSFVR